MSSDLDSDEEVVAMNRAANRLFKSFSSDEEEEVEEVENASKNNNERRPNNKKKRIVPRFLGDSDSDDNNNNNNLAHNRLFDDDDLDQVSNNHQQQQNQQLIPKRLDTKALDRLLQGDGDRDDIGNVISSTAIGGDGDGMDIDGITAVKKRRIIAKMDDVRLLGPTGFPALQKEVMKFKVKGKGHETQDLKRLMSIYQLWSHQMYPKTNLKDTLQSVEKLCHKRSVHRALKGYREEAKNKGIKPIPIPIPEIEIENQFLSDQEEEDQDQDQFQSIPKASTSKSTSNIEPRRSSRQSTPLTEIERVELVRKEKEVEEDLFGDDDDDDLFAEMDKAIELAEAVKANAAKVADVVEEEEEQGEQEEEFDWEADEIMRGME